MIKVGCTGLAVLLLFALTGLVYSGLVTELCPYDVDALTD